MINYSIEVLEREKYLLNMCLSTWDENHYPEARKERERKLKDIENTLNKIKNDKSG